jgi:anaerobic selenocysteine-containing dehydrogenase
MTFAAIRGRGVVNGNTEVLKYLVRIRRHGRSEVFTIPPDIKAKLAIKQGDYMQVWEERGMIHAVKIDLEKLADYSRAGATV